MVLRVCLPSDVLHVDSYLSGAFTVASLLLCSQNFVELIFSSTYYVRSKTRNYQTLYTAWILLKLGELTFFATPSNDLAGKSSRLIVTSESNAHALRYAIDRLEI